MIRPARSGELPAILPVYAEARAFMAAHGNPTQWGTDRPSPDLLAADIAAGTLFVEEEDGAVRGAFALVAGEDPTYAVITGGAWRDLSPYLTLHRVAGVGAAPGFFARCVVFALGRCPHLRCDTHRDNLPMQHALERSGFRPCGTILADDGTPRIAYEYTSPERSDPRE